MPTANEVLSAEGLLAEFNAAEVLEAADVHAARLLCDLWEEPDDRVRLAVALVVRALRGGSVCLDITRLAELVIDTLEDPPEDLTWPEPSAWGDAIRRSPAVATGGSGAGGHPLRLIGDLLYLERYWRTEETVRQHLAIRQDTTTAFDVGAGSQTEGAPDPSAAMVRRELDALFDEQDLPADEPHHQRLAATMTGLSRITVIAGGPGTGKTTVVAKILALHHALRDRPPIVALAAPTGKAAARLEEAILQTMTGLGAQWSTTPVPRAVTLHTLLGWTPGKTPRHRADNPLPHELVVVDEMSMVSLPQMAALLEALRPEARLVLVGDPDQLASVDAGAVLADITRAAPPAPAAQLAALAELAELAPGDRPTASPTGAGVVTLQYTWRFGGGIEQLARAIRAGDAERALEVLQGDAADVRLVPADGGVNPADLGDLQHQVVAAGRRMYAEAVAGDAAGALAALEEHRVLCAHRRGPFGVARWERQVHEWLRTAIPSYDGAGDFHPGLPIMVTDNDRDAGLYNGDTGVVVQTAQGLRAAFARGGTPKLFTSLQLREIASVHAMTVHKSQGSQFRRITLVLPPVTSPLLTRELLYTAVTRASDGVEIIGSPEAVARAVQRPANRASGLGGRRN